MDNTQSAETTNKFHRFLTENLKLTSLKVFIVILAIGLIDELLVGYLTGHWHSTPSVLGAEDDYPHWIVSFIFQPAIWAFLIWLPPATERIFGLIEDQAIPETYKDAYHQALIPFLSFINSPLISWLSLILGVILVILSHFFTAQYMPVPWTYHVEWHRYTIWSIRLLAAGYSFSFTVIYSILVTVNLNKVFNRYGVRLHLYHGDNVAGLKFIGQFALELNRLALISIAFLISDLLLAIQVGHGILGQTNLIFELIAFPTITLVSFVAPLITCHWAMRDAKVAELNRQAVQIQADLQALRSNPDVSKEQIERLTALINFRQRLGADIPTMPIDITAIRTFSLSFIASLIPAVISLIIDIIKK